MINESVQSDKKETQSVTNASSPQKRKRGAFPRLSLKKSLELSKAIYKLGQGEPIRRLNIFDSLGKSAESGSSRSLVTNSSAYGLTKGGYQADYLELTEKGKMLISINEERKKYEVAYDILFANDLFSGFIEYWKNKQLPSDEIAPDWFVRNFQLTASDAKAAWDVIKENIDDWKLTELLSGKQVILSKDIASESLKKIFGNLHEAEILEATRGISETLTKVEEKEPSLVQSNTIEQGLAGFERKYTYGTARMIFPAKMKQTELDKMKMAIDGLVEVVEP